MGRGRSRSRSGVHDGSLLPSRMASVTDDEHGPGCEASTAGTGAGDGGLCIGTPDATEENAQARHLASLTTMGDTANACAAYLTATGTNAGHTAADEGYMQGLSNGMPPVADDGGGAVQRPASKAGTAVVRALCPQAFDGEEGVVRARSWAEGALGAAAKPKRLLNELRGASFRLEAAQAPRGGSVRCVPSLLCACYQDAQWRPSSHSRTRCVAPRGGAVATVCTCSLPPRAGASKLQPIIATIHERLKAAQVRLGGACPLRSQPPCLVLLNGCACAAAAAHVSAPTAPCWIHRDGPWTQGKYTNPVGVGLPYPYQGRP